MGKEADNNKKVNEKTLSETVLEYEFERNKAVGGVLGGQERIDLNILKEKGANQEEINEFLNGVRKINDEAASAEADYEKVVKRFSKYTLGIK